ncbi:MAG: sugar phosphate isomerase/epimerase [Armatimonadetes bacterium]|nr:sugar phosphate isomerase/epimerase [Armatimonadota bacterium]
MVTFTETVRLSYVLATPEVTGAGVTAYRAPLERSFRRLADLGYDGAELMMKRPAENSVEEVLRLCDRHGLVVPVLCTGEVYGEDGLSFIDPDESVRVAARERMKEFITFAAPLKAAVNIGRLRGRFCPEVPESVARYWAEDAFREAADHAGDLGVTIVLEPIAPTIHDFITTTAAGVETVRRIGHPHFQLMLDVAHIAHAGEVPAEAVRCAGKHLKHVHITEPDRGAPGTGDFDFARLVAELKAVGYDGFLSAELSQQPDQETAVEQTARVMLPLMKGDER